MTDCRLQKLWEPAERVPVLRVLGLTSDAFEDLRTMDWALEPLTRDMTQGTLCGLPAWLSCTILRDSEQEKGAEQKRGFTTRGCSHPQTVLS